MTTPNTLCGRCGDARFAHETELAPQCASSGCTCLAFKLPHGLRAVPTPDPNGRHIRVVPLAEVRSVSPGGTAKVGATVITLPAPTIVTLPPATAALLDAAAASPFERTRNLGVKLAGLIDDLRSRLETEQRKATAQAAQLRRTRQTVKRFDDPRACGVDGCVREFDTVQAITMHRRRAHEGWGHVGRPARAQEQNGHPATEANA